MHKFETKIRKTIEIDRKTSMKTGKSMFLLQDSFDVCHRRNDESELPLSARCSAKVKEKTAGRKCHNQAAFYAKLKEDDDIERVQNCKINAPPK